MPVPPVQAKPTAQPAELPDIDLDPSNYQIGLDNPLASMFGHGNLTATLPVQPKLTVGAVGDKYEQEADRVAAQVVSAMHSPAAAQPAQRETLQREAMEEEDLQMQPTTVQRQAMEEEDELQMKPATAQRVGAKGGAVSDNFEQQLQSAKGSGQALNTGLQAQMGQAMGADFRGVKVHTDSQSDQLNQSIQAKAFTTGQDVFFRHGAYQPGSRSGQELIAHELTHVVQQNKDAVKRQGISRSHQTGEITNIPHFPVQRLWDKKQFIKNTKEGRLNRRGKTLKKIEALLKEYHKDSYLTQDNVNTGIDLLREIKEHTKNWIEDHDGDRSRKKRMVKMKKFLKQVVSEKKSLFKWKRQFKQHNQQRQQLGGQKKTLKPSARKGNRQHIREKHQGSAKSALTRVGWLLDSSVPNPGDKSKLEFDLRIPVEPTGEAFMGFHLVCESERKKRTELKTRCELTLTGGAKFGGVAELKAELGGYFEAQAKNSDQVMQVISYALYRRFVESKVLPVEASNFMWGGTTSSVGYKRAERWAANVEKEVFSKDKKAYGETGALGAVGGKGKVLDAGGVGLEGKAKLKAAMGTRYDQASLIEGKKRLFQNPKNSQDKGKGQLGDTYTYSGRGDAQKHIGKSVYFVEPSLEGRVGPFKLKGKAKWVWLGNPKKSDKAALNEWSIEFAGAGMIPIHKGVLAGGPALVGALVNQATQITRKAFAWKASDTKTGEMLGTVVNFAEDGTIAAVQLAKVPAKEFVAFEPGKSLDDKPGIEGSKGEIGVSVKLKYKKKTSDKSGSWEITLDYVKSHKLQYVDKLYEAQKHAIDLFTLKQETSSRLLTIKYEKGSWSLSSEF